MASGPGGAIALTAATTTTPVVTTVGLVSAPVVATAGPAVIGGLALAGAAIAVGTLLIPYIPIAGAAVGIVAGIKKRRARRRARKGGQTVVTEPSVQEVPNLVYEPTLTPTVSRVPVAAGAPGGRPPRRPKDPLDPRDPGDEDPKKKRECDDDNPANVPIKANDFTNALKLFNLLQTADGDLLNQVHNAIAVASQGTRIVLTNLQENAANIRRGGPTVGPDIPTLRLDARTRLRLSIGDSTLTPPSAPPPPRMGAFLNPSPWSEQVWFNNRPIGGNGDYVHNLTGSYTQQLNAIIDKYNEQPKGVAEDGVMPTGVRPLTADEITISYTPNALINFFGPELYELTPPGGANPESNKYLDELMQGMLTGQTVTLPQQQLIKEGVKRVAPPKIIKEEKVIVGKDPELEEEGELVLEPPEEKPSIPFIPSPEELTKFKEALQLGGTEVTLPPSTQEIPGTFKVKKKVKKKAKKKKLEIWKRLSPGGAPYPASAMPEELETYLQITAPTVYEEIAEPGLVKRDEARMKEKIEETIVGRKLTTIEEEEYKPAIKLGARKLKEKRLVRRIEKIVEIMFGEVSSGNMKMSQLENVIKKEFGIRDKETIERIRLRVKGAWLSKPRLAPKPQKTLSDLMEEPKETPEFKQKAKRIAEKILEAINLGNIRLDQVPEFIETMGIKNAPLKEKILGIVEVERAKIIEFKQVQEVFSSEWDDAPEYIDDAIEATLKQAEEALEFQEGFEEPEITKKAPKKKKKLVIPTEDITEFLERDKDLPVIQGELATEEDIQAFLRARRIAKARERGKLGFPVLEKFKKTLGALNKGWTFSIPKPDIKGKIKELLEKARVRRLRRKGIRRVGVITTPDVEKVGRPPSRLLAEFDEAFKVLKKPFPEIEAEIQEGIEITKKGFKKLKAEAKRRKVIKKLKAKAKAKRRKMLEGLKGYEVLQREARRLDIAQQPEGIIEEPLDPSFEGAGAPPRLWREAKEAAHMVMAGLPIEQIRADLQEAMEIIERPIKRRKAKKKRIATVKSLSRAREIAEHQKEAERLFKEQIKLEETELEGVAPKKEKPIEEMSFEEQQLLLLGAGQEEIEIPGPGEEPPPQVSQVLLNMATTLKKLQEKSKKGKLTWKEKLRKEEAEKTLYENLSDKTLETLGISLGEEAAPVEKPKKVVKKKPVKKAEKKLAVIPVDKKDFDAAAKVKFGASVFEEHAEDFHAWASIDENRRKLREEAQKAKRTELEKKYPDTIWLTTKEHKARKALKKIEKKLASGKPVKKIPVDPNDIRLEAEKRLKQEGEKATLDAIDEFVSIHMESLKERVQKARRNEVEQGWPGTVWLTSMEFAEYKKTKIKVGKVETQAPKKVKEEKVISQALTEEEHERNLAISIAKKAMEIAKKQGLSANEAIQAHLLEYSTMGINVPKESVALAKKFLNNALSGEGFIPPFIEDEDSDDDEDFSSPPMAPTIDEVTFPTAYIGQGMTSTERARLLELLRGGTQAAQPTVVETAEEELFEVPPPPEATVSLEPAEEEIWETLSTPEDEPEEEEPEEAPPITEGVFETAAPEMEFEEEFEFEKALTEAEKQENLVRRVAKNAFVIYSDPYFSGNLTEAVLEALHQLGVGSFSGKFIVRASEYMGAKEQFGTPIPEPIQDDTQAQPFPEENILKKFKKQLESHGKVSTTDVSEEFPALTKRLKALPKVSKKVEKSILKARKKQIKKNGLKAVKPPKVIPRDKLKKVTPPPEGNILVEHKKRIVKARKELEAIRKKWKEDVSKISNKEKKELARKLLNARDQFYVTLLSYKIGQERREIKRENLYVSLLETTNKVKTLKEAKKTAKEAWEKENAELAKEEQDYNKNRKEMLKFLLEEYEAKHGPAPVKVIRSLKEALNPIDTIRRIGYMINAETFMQTGKSVTDRIKEAFGEKTTLGKIKNLGLKIERLSKQALGIRSKKDFIAVLKKSRQDILKEEAPDYVGMVKDLEEKFGKPGELSQKRVKKEQEWRKNRKKFGREILAERLRVTFSKQGFGSKESEEIIKQKKELEVLDFESEIRAKRIKEIEKQIAALDKLYKKLKRKIVLPATKKTIREDVKSTKEIKATNDKIKELDEKLSEVQKQKIDREVEYEKAIAFYKGYRSPHKIAQAIFGITFLPGFLIAKAIEEEKIKERKRSIEVLDKAVSELKAEAPQSAEKEKEKYQEANKSLIVAQRNFDNSNKLTRKALKNKLEKAKAKANKAWSDYRSVLDQKKTLDNMAVISKLEKAKIVGNKEKLKQVEAKKKEEFKELNSLTKFLKSQKKAAKKGEALDKEGISERLKQFEENKEKVSKEKPLSPKTPTFLSTETPTPKVGKLRPAVSRAELDASAAKIKVGGIIYNLDLLFSPDAEKQNLAIKNKVKEDILNLVKEEEPLQRKERIKKPPAAKVGEVRAKSKEELAEIKKRIKPQQEKIKAKLEEQENVPKKPRKKKPEERIKKEVEFGTTPKITKITKGIANILKKVRKGGGDGGGDGDNDPWTGWGGFFRKGAVGGAAVLTAGTFTGLATIGSIYVAKKVKEDRPQDEEITPEPPQPPWDGGDDDGYEPKPGDDSDEPKPKPPSDDDGPKPPDFYHDPWPEGTTREEREKTKHRKTVDKLTGVQVVQKDVDDEEQVIDSMEGVCQKDAQGLVTCQFDAHNFAETVNQILY